MKKMLVTVLVAGAALMVGCADDIILEEEAPLMGHYEGTYEVTLNYGAVNDSTLFSPVWVSFIEEIYIMKLDTVNFDIDSNVCFCRVNGKFALTDGVRFKEDKSQPDGEVNCMACNEEYNPDGTFQRENQGSRLILKSQVGTTFMQLDLKPREIVEDPEEPSE